MQLRLVASLALLCAPAALAQYQNPLALQAEQVVFQSGGLMTWFVLGAPSQPGVVLADLSPGPTTLPGLGTFQLGFTPSLVAVPVVLDPTGTVMVSDAALGPPQQQQDRLLLAIDARIRGLI